MSGEPSTTYWYRAVVLPKNFAASQVAGLAQIDAPPLRRAAAGCAPAGVGVAVVGRFGRIALLARRSSGRLLVGHVVLRGESHFRRRRLVLGHDQRHRGVARLGNRDDLAAGGPFDFQLYIMRRCACLVKDHERVLAILEPTFGQIHARAGNLFRIAAKVVAVEPSRATGERFGNQAEDAAGDRLVLNLAR